MIFRSVDDCKRRAHDLRVRLIAEDLSLSSPLDTPFVRFSIEEVPNARIALARTFVQWLGDFQDCEFWISEFGIWPSSEDRNLYRRLRSTYGDSRELYDAPAHLFDAHEKSDLETYLAIAMQFGWGGHIIPNEPESYLFLSHDSWLHVASTKAHERIKIDLSELEIEYEVGGAPVAGRRHQ
jgi:hypothetical protein